ncbi:MAG: pyridoxine 5'-phosphate synthase [Bacteroidetes bacterium]|nr:MAG: pyridoxine 5'-phosphate synthase [Bacteroidota bacterium]
MRLAINIDHVATVRNARGGLLPDPIAAALIAEKAGVKGIVCHLREDRRHIRDEDVVRLRKAITTKLDLEMSIAPDIVAVAKRVKPELATLVPERRKELTTEGGLDVVRFSKKVRKTIEQLHDSVIAVSLFVDPVRGQIEEAKAIGADMVELHTGEYAEAHTRSEQNKHLKQIRAMASFARDLGLEVNAGHGLDYTNIQPIAAIDDIEEVSIGHAIIARAVFVGLEHAVREMVELIQGKNIK